MRNVNHNYSLNSSFRYIKHKRYIVFANIYFHIIVSKSMFKIIRSKDKQLQVIYRSVNPIFYLFSFLKDYKHDQNYNTNKIKYCRGGYFHWLLDYLPYIKKNSEIDIPFNVENRDKFIRLIGTNPITEKSSYYPSIKEIDWCRSELIKLKSEKKFPKKILILRKNKGLRYLINSGSLEEILKDKGFTTVYLEEFTIEEQIALFNGAEVIVAIHGAALSNLVFAKEGVKVIELMPENEVKWHFWLISKILNLNYTLVLVDVLNFDNNNRALDLKINNLEWFHSL